MRDLDLRKNSAELLASRLKDRNLLAPGTVVSFYRNREKDSVQFFRMEDEFIFCDDINDLLNSMSCEYEPAEWRLFIGSSKRSLKCVLLHMKQVLEKLNYSECNWKICGDFKFVCMLLGQQGGYIKYTCFLYLWESGANKGPVGET